MARRGNGADRHVRFAGAGHLVRLAVLPTDAQWTGGIALGGDRAAQAAAQRAAITEVIRPVGPDARGDRGRPDGESPISRRRVLIFVTASPRSVTASLGPRDGGGDSPT